ncbi:MAG TPA: replication initiator protein A [Isosphaeraceae bacterium]|jgi:hypothetical protein|nr:replication initiator protein A [Isosphaeraceae bacterium]
MAAKAGTNKDQAESEGNRATEAESRRDPDPRKALQPAGGRDELNLAEFPITLLADRVPEGCKTLVFEDEVYDQQTQKVVTRKLTITGSDAHGLPTAADDEILVALIQLTKLNNNFTERKVRFTRYELLKLLGWRDVGKNYRRVEESLNRWMGVTLYYDKAWWNKEAQSWVSEKFHIIDNVTIVDREDGRRLRAKGRQEMALSSFSWNQVVFQSFQADNLKRLDVDLYFALASAVSKRMFRFLDKRFYHRRRWEFDLQEFAFEHIGLSRAYEDNGKIKEKLQPALDELTAIGFLEPLRHDERYLKVGRGAWKIVLIQKGAAADPEPPAIEPGVPAAELVEQLVARGVTPKVAAELVEQHAPELVRKNIEVHDWMKTSGGKRFQRNPAGFLVASIRSDYRPPADYRSTQAKAEAARLAEMDERRRKAEARADEARTRAREAELRARWEALPEPERAAILAAVRAENPGLGRWKKMLEPLCWAKMDDPNRPLFPTQKTLFRDADAG